MVGLRRGWLRLAVPAVGAVAFVLVYLAALGWLPALLSWAQRYVDFRLGQDVLGWVQQAGAIGLAFGAAGVVVRWALGRVGGPGRFGGEVPDDEVVGETAWLLLAELLRISHKQQERRRDGRGDEGASGATAAGATSFGVLLRQLRIRSGMAQEDLAHRAGLGERTIRRLESGQVNARLSTVDAVATALGLTAQERTALLSAAGHGTALDVDSGKPLAASDSPRGVASVFGDAVAGWPPLRVDVLAGYADQLAREIGRRWQAQEERRRIHDPFPLPVRWRLAPAFLMDHRDSIYGAAPAAASDPVDLDGDLVEVVGTYRRMPSGRLVVLGRAGSGKTVLAIRFVRDYLRTRAVTDPVPVIFHVGSWDPTAVALRDWLIDQLLCHYSGLNRTIAGRSTLAAVLVQDNRILPVLDGFDEIASGLRSDALTALNDTSLPMLLTSRADEYAAAVAASRPLVGAACVELDDLTLCDLENYLPRTARVLASGDDRGVGATVWDPVLRQLRGHADMADSANLITVLSTPLMIFLARAVYSDAPGQDPAVLLDITRFPTAQAIEDHLLASFVHTAYQRRPARVTVPGGPGRRRWDPDRAQRWLGHLAHHLDMLGTRDVAWWQMGKPPRWSRLLAVILASTLAATASDLLAATPLYFSRSGDSGLWPLLYEALSVGAAVGPAIGLVYGLMVRFARMTFEPSRVQLRLFGRQGATTDAFARRFAKMCGAGLLGGFIVGMGNFFLYGLLVLLVGDLPPGVGSGDFIRIILIDMFLYGLVAGFATALVLGLTHALEEPLDVIYARDPTSLLAENRTTVLRQIMAQVPMFTLTIALGLWLVVHLFDELLGPLVFDLLSALTIGVIGGLSGALSYALAFTAWGQWLILARIWLPLTGRMPWRILAFLNDAYQRDVLRHAGAVYQFRHARLQDHLSNAHRATHSHGHRRADTTARNAGQPQAEA